MRVSLFFISISLFLLASCWPKSLFSPVDISMPPEWREFFVENIEVNSATAPSSYNATLAEAIRTGVQNNTRLKLVQKVKDSTLRIQSVVNSYATSPIAVQGNDQAAQNRLTVSMNVTIFTPTKGLEEITFSASRFADYPSSSQLSDVEVGLLETINQQLVQDIINKLLSNW